MTVAQYRAYLNSFGGADIPSVAAFRERVLAGLRKAGCRRSEGGHDSGEALDAPRVFLFRVRNWMTANARSRSFPTHPF